MSHSPHILCIDDEQNILNSLKRMLRKEGYTLHMTTDPDEAIDIIKNNKVELAISDQRMPKMCGTDFLREVRGVSPETVRIILSGYSEINTVIDAINCGEVFRFILKPWEDDFLKQIIKECLQHYSLSCPQNSINSLIASNYPGATILLDNSNNICSAISNVEGFNVSEMVGKGVGDILLEDIANAANNCLQEDKVVKLDVSINKDDFKCSIVPIKSDAYAVCVYLTL